MNLVRDVLLVVINKLFNKGKNQSSSGTEISEEQKAAQDWMPVYDINGGFAYRRDKHIVAAIKVQPVNIHLLSKQEQKNKIKSLLEVLNGVEHPLQLFSIARPVDLDGYIAELENYKSNANLKKAKILDHYIQTAAAKAASGTALERSFYVIINDKQEKNAQVYLYEKAKAIAQNLTSAGLEAGVCDDQELRNLYFVFTHPAQASIERAPTNIYGLPMIYDSEMA